MSTLIVEVCKVEEIAVHPNADRIERVRVKNWWCIAGKSQYTVGDKVVYVPPDSVLPEQLAEKWGIAKYCVPIGRNISGERPAGLRVRASRFRGVSSFGTIQNLDDPEWEVGKDVREYYGITKWEPPMRASDGDAAPNVPAFHEYTSIEALGNFPAVFQDGEEVVVTEKIHGTNSRVGWVFHPDTEVGGFTWQKMAGSHGTRRKEFNDKGVRSKYWFPFSPMLNHKEPCAITSLLMDVASIEKAKTSVVVFGEIFGAGIQDMQYGQKSLAYRIFDIAVDGNYLDFDKLKLYVGADPKLQLVPILYRGPYSLAKMDELVDGPTTIAKTEEIREPFKGREGIVIKPIKERFDSILGGRAILKYVSVDYHERRNKERTEDH
jgi:RNA ligase (TIGR02306 family)